DRRGSGAGSGDQGRDRQQAPNEARDRSRAPSSRASIAQGTSGPQGFPPGPDSPQSTCRRFLPSYGVGRNGNFLAMPLAVMSTPTTPGAPARKLTPSPARFAM